MPGCKVTDQGLACPTASRMVKVIPSNAAPMVCSVGHVLCMCCENMCLLNAHGVKTHASVHKYLYLKIFIAHFYVTHLYIHPLFVISVYIPVRICRVLYFSLFSIITVAHILYALVHSCLHVHICTRARVRAHTHTHLPPFSPA